MGRMRGKNGRIIRVGDRGEKSTQPQLNSPLSDTEIHVSEARVGHRRIASQNMRDCRRSMHTRDEGGNIDIIAKPTDDNEVIASDDNEVIASEAPAVEPSLVSDPRRGRGRNVLPPEPLSENRGVIYVRNHLSFGGCTSIVQRITSIVKNHTLRPFRSYRNFTEDMKEACWDQFLRYYRFETSKEYDTGKKTFQYLAQDRYADSLRKLRGKATQKFGSDMNAWKDWIEPFMGSENWNQLIDYWLTPEWQAIAATAKKNRNVNGNLVHHTTGSISYQAHYEKMEKQLKRRPTWGEFYRKTHTSKKTSDYPSKKSKDVIETYEKLVENKTGEQETTETGVVMDLWLQASGGISNGKVYGMTDMVDHRAIKCNTRSHEIFTPGIPSSRPSPAQAFLSDPDVKELLARERDETVQRTIDMFRRQGIIRFHSNRRPTLRYPTSNASNIHNDDDYDLDSYQSHDDNEDLHDLDVNEDIDYDGS